MNIATKRLTIGELIPEMAYRLHQLSLDEDTRRFVPDEVFETPEEAAEVIAYLRGCYQSGEGPQVYALSLSDGLLIGYVQAVPLADGWEIGYHIGEAYTRQGFASEAVQAFLPPIMQRLGIDTMTGICLAENKASIRVMEHCGFQEQFRGVADYQGKPAHICRFLYKLV